MTDHLERLEGLMAKAPPGPWQREGDYTVASVPAPGLHVANCRSYQDGRLDYENSDAAAELIHVLRNAAPALIEIAKKARELSDHANGTFPREGSLEYKGKFALLREALQRLGRGEGRGNHERLMQEGRDVESENRPRQGEV